MQSIRYKKRIPSNVSKYIKNAGYVRGYFPELASHIGEWIPGAAKSTGSFAWNNLGKLVLLGGLLSGGYALYNKFKNNKKKEKDDDDINYSKVPNDVKSNRKASDKWDNYSWPDTEPDNSDYDDDTDDGLPMSVLTPRSSFALRSPATSNIATTIALANRKPGNSIILKTSSYILNKSNNRVNTVKEWLYK